MALALQMFSAIEHGVAAHEAVTAADERWAWVALAQVPGSRGMRGATMTSWPRYRPRRSSRRPAGPSPGSSGRSPRGASSRFDWRQVVAPAGGAGAARCGARLVLLPDAGLPGPAPADRPAAAVPAGPGRASSGRTRWRGHRRVAPRHALRAPDGGAAGRRPGRPRGDGRERPGSGGGHRGPPGGPRRPGPDHRRPGLWRGRRVSPREPAAWRAEVAEAGAVVSQFPMGTPPPAASLPGAEPSHRRAHPRHRGRRGRGAKRGPHHGAPGRRARPGGLRGARQRLVPGEPGHERPDPGRREARPGVGGRRGGVAPGAGERRLRPVPSAARPVGPDAGSAADARGVGPPGVARGRAGRHRRASWSRAGSRRARCRRS